MAYNDDGMIRVNFSSVAAAADSIDRIQRAIDGQLSQLRAYCDTATSRWTGPARDAYHGLQSDWDATALELNTKLADIAKGVRTSHSIFSTAEARNARAWTP